MNNDGLMEILKRLEDRRMLAMTKVSPCVEISITRETSAAEKPQASSLTEKHASLG
jgi:hypothetical protein